MVFLKIPNVPKGTVFAEQVTYYFIFIATHKAILFNLLLLNWIRHRKTDTIAINKTVPPTVMPMMAPVEIDSSVSVSRK